VKLLIFLTNRLHRVIKMLAKVASILPIGKGNAPSEPVKSHKFSVADLRMACHKLFRHYDMIQWMVHRKI